MRKAVPAVLLALAVFLLYRKVTRLWWTFDDVYHLKVAVAHDWTLPFTDKVVWPQNLFTPLLSATHELLFAAFSIDAARWYAVHLALLVLASLGVLAALRLYVPRPAALAGAFLFAAGVPLSATATQIMVIHHLEAILLGSLSLVLYVEGVRRHRQWMSILSALLYLAAILAKGSAILLPLFLLALPERDLEKRLRHLIGHLVAVVAFIGWRWMVFGTLSGAYGGFALAPHELPLLIVTLPFKVIAACAGAAPAAGLALIAVMLVAAATLFRTRRHAALAVIGLLLVLAPLIPISKALKPTDAVVPWLWMCALFAVGIEHVRWRNAVILLALAFAGIANRQEWTAEYNRARRMSEEARFFVGMGGDAILRHPRIPPATMSELVWLKEIHLQRPAGGQWFYDDLFLCNAQFSGKRLFEFDDERRQVVEITARVPDLAARYCAEIRLDAPLRAEFHHRDQALFWRFGPYESGKWSVVIANGLQAFEVPREDGFRLAGLNGIALRVRYQAPEGWVTYSPEIALDFAREPDRVWRR
ncbi:MAG TPA: hypothetical protein VGF48_24575 [Thermoanaerobaculia bacterium]